MCLQLLTVLHMHPMYSHTVQWLPSIMNREGPIKLADFSSPILFLGKDKSTLIQYNPTLLSTFQFRAWFHGLMAPTARSTSTSPDISLFEPKSSRPKFPQHNPDQPIVLRPHCPHGSLSQLVTRSTLFV